MEAEMGYEEYQDFFYGACKADPPTPDPVAEWQARSRPASRRYIDRIQGHDQVELRGPNVDLTLSIKGRKFINACGSTTCRMARSTPARSKIPPTAGCAITYPAGLLKARSFPASS